MSPRSGAPPQNRENLYKRGSVWWGRIWIAGQEIRWTLRTRDADVARRRVEQRRREMLKQAATAGVADRMSWPDAVAAWAPHIAGNISAQTAKRYAVSLGQVERWLKPLYLDEITQKTLNALFRERKEAGASNATARRDLTAIS